MLIKTDEIKSASELELIQHMARYVKKPALWAKEICGFEVDEWNKEAFEEFAEDRFVAWSAGSGVGKTASLAILILFFLSTRYMPKVAATAPSQHQLHDVLWAEISKWLNQSDFLKKYFKWTQTKVSMKGDLGQQWFAVARTSKPPAGGSSAAVEGLQGFHAGDILFVVDEASGVPDQVMYAVEGALTTPGAHAILASNPTRRSGFFYRIISDPRYQEDWRVRFINAENAKWVDPKAVARVARVYGTYSDYYRIKVRGLPPLSDSKALLTPEQVYGAHERDLEEIDAPVYLSCDPARYGGDPSVFYVRRGMRVIHRETVNGMNTIEVANVGLNLVKLFNPKLYYIDTIGLGAGVVDVTRDKLKKRKNIVIDVHVGKNASDDKTFLNMRAELFWSMREIIDKISIPFETELLDDELTTVQYFWTGSDSRIKIQSKDEIRNALGRSCNDADALVLCFYEELIGAMMKDVNPAVFDVGASQAMQALSAADVGRHDSNLDSFGPGFGAGNTGMGYGMRNQVGSTFERVGRSRFRDIGS
jgi:hypothetical protein